MKEIGHLLKEKRQSLNVSLEEVSIATKINIRILHALEDGDLDSLPAKTFIRGFVQTYAKYLGLDVKEVLGKLQEILGSTKPQMIQIQEPTANDGKSSQGGQLEGDFLGKSKSVLTFAAIIITIVAIIIIQKVISKRETSLKNTEVQAITGSDAPVNIPSTASAGSNLADEPEPPAPTPRPALAAAPTPLPKPIVTLSPSPTPTPKPSPRPVVVVVATPTPSPTPLPTPTPAAVVAPVIPQELIVEALDNVNIKISLDGKPAQEIIMGADQIQTFKARGKIKLSTSNSGAISIIHNGKEIGVPGNLGQAQTLSFP